MTPRDVTPLAPPRRSGDTGCVAATQELPVPTEKVDATPAVSELLKPLEMRIAALEKLTKAQQEVIEKLNAVYKKPWSSSAGA